MKLKLDKIGQYEEEGQNISTKLLVFVEETRPLYEEGDIIADIKWRREHKQPYKNSDILVALKEIIADIKILSVSYSRYAGCSMCPCSPGYVAITEPYEGEVKAAWVKEIK